MYRFDRPPVPMAIHMAGEIRSSDAGHRCAYMGQGTTCETTPEGGTLCSDGTYHPPGCPTQPPVRAEEAPSGATVPLLVGAGALGIAAAIFAISR